MKRLILLIVVVMLAYWVLARHRVAHMRPAPRGTGTVRIMPRTVKPGGNLVAKAGHEVKQALRKPGMRFAMPSARRATRFISAIDEVRGALFSDDETMGNRPSSPRRSSNARKPMGFRCQSFRARA